jgi:hypothetical protein
MEDVVGVEGRGGVGVEAGDHDSAGTTATLCTAELGASESRFWREINKKRKRDCGKRDWETVSYGML